MGQKVNPHGLRVGIIKDWDSRWYAEKDFADNLVEDDKIRKYIKNRLYSAGISRTEIERASDRVKIIIHTAKPGIVIGRGGSAIDELKKELEKLTGKKLIIEIKEVKRFDVDKDAQLVAENIAQQLENRMARTEFYSEGTIPLQTLRANIDYGFAEANTTYGKVGVKVWVYHGEVLPTKETKEGSDK